MTDEQAKAASGTEAAQEVDRIREIIFGHQMRDYQDQFQAIQGEMANLKGEVARLSDSLSKQESAQSKKLQALHRELRKADEAMRDELRQEFQKLTEQMQAVDSFREEFQQAIQRLTAEKVDHAALGELFVEVGTHILTNDSLTDLMQDVDDQEVE